MRTLFLCSRILAQIRSGTDLRVQSQISALVQIGPTAVFSVEYSNVQPIPGDTLGLASKIRELLLNTDLRRSLGESGHNWAVENFQLSESVKSYEALCRLLISEDDAVN